MKSILLLAAILVFTQLNAEAQLVFLNYELGYNANFASPNGVNIVVNEYNITRDFLTKEMKEFDYFGGFTTEMGVGIYSEYSYTGLYIGAGYNGGSQKRYAEGSVNGTNGRRDVRVTDRSGFLSLGLINISQSGLFGMILGARGEFSFVKARTKTANTEWETTDNNVIPYLSPYLKVLIGPVNIEPYYRFELFKGDEDFGVEELNKEINPNTANSDPSYGIPYGGNSFGIRITFNIFPRLVY